MMCHEQNDYLLTRNHEAVVCWQVLLTGRQSRSGVNRLSDWLPTIWYAILNGCF